MTASIERPARAASRLVALAVAVACCRRDPVAFDLEGRAVDPFAGPQAVRAFVFLSVDCPISNRYAPEVRSLHDRFAARGVAFHLVYPDAATDAAEVRAHLRSYGLPPRALRDPGHALARRGRVTITPEAAVFAGTSLVYRGRIDDRFVSFNRERPRATRRELVDAIEAALAGRAPAVAEAPAVGCTLSDTP